MMEQVGYSPTRQTLFALSAKRRKGAGRGRGREGGREREGGR